MLLQSKTLVTFGAVSSLHADTIDYQSRITANGGTISTAHLNAVDTFVKWCYANGLRDTVAANSVILDCCPFMGDQLAAASVKLWYPSGGQSKLTLNNIVAADYTIVGGIDVGASNTTKYSDTGTNPATIGVSANGGHLSYYCTSNRSSTDAADIEAIGANYATAFSIYANAGGKAYSAFFDDNGNSNGVVTTAVGFLVASRLSSSSHTFHKNGAQISAIGGSGTLPNATITIGRDLLSGTYSKQATGFYSVGAKGIPSATQSGFYSAVLSLLQSIGRA